MLVVLATAAAVAAPQPFADSAPPERFTGNVVMQLDIRDQEGINAACHPLYGAPPPGMQTNGCAFGSTVVLSNPCALAATESYARLLCHELGHVNGWSADHEG